MSDESTKKKPNDIRKGVSAQKAEEADINEDDVISDDAIGGIDFFDAPGAFEAQVN